MDIESEKTLVGKFYFNYKQEILPDGVAYSVFNQWGAKIFGWKRALLEVKNPGNVGLYGRSKKQLRFFLTNIST